MTGHSTWVPYLRVKPLWQMLHSKGLWVSWTFWCRLRCSCRLKLRGHCPHWNFSIFAQLETHWGLSTSSRWLGEALDVTSWGQMSSRELGWDEPHFSPHDRKRFNATSPEDGVDVDENLSKYFIICKAYSKMESHFHKLSFNSLWILNIIESSSKLWTQLIDRRSIPRSHPFTATLN